MLRVLIALCLSLVPACMLAPSGLPVSLVRVTFSAGDAYLVTDGLAFVAWGPAVALTIESKAEELWTLPDDWDFSQELLQGKVVVGRLVPDPELLYLLPGDPLPPWASSLVPGGDTPSGTARSPSLN